MQSIDSLVRKYGQIIVDECHHIGPVSSDAILKEANARYVHGLTATPVRRDGLLPIIFMHSGPIPHIAARPKESLHNLQVKSRPRFTNGNLPSNARIQDDFKENALDQERNSAIVNVTRLAFGQSRKVLALTERTDHLDALASALVSLRLSPFVLHVRLSKKKHTMLIFELNGLPSDASVLCCQQENWSVKGLTILHWIRWFTPSPLWDSWSILQQYPLRINEVL